MALRLRSSYLVAETGFRYKILITNTNWRLADSLLSEVATEQLFGNVTP
jgi:hypothetical protein